MLAVVVISTKTVTDSRVETVTLTHTLWKSLRLIWSGISTRSTEERRAVNHCVILFFLLYEPQHVISNNVAF